MYWMIVKIGVKKMKIRCKNNEWFHFFFNMRRFIPLLEMKIGDLIENIREYERLNTEGN